MGSLFLMQMMKFMLKGRVVSRSCTCFITLDGAHTEANKQGECVPPASYRNNETQKEFFTDDAVIPSERHFHQRATLTSQSGINESSSAAVSLSCICCYEEHQCCPGHD